jgi:DNA-binding MarR family transcriptional regulator
MSESLSSEALARVAGTCFCRQARMAARKITRAYDEALRPVNLRVTQFTLLVAVSYETPASITALADWLGMERTTLTRNLQILQHKGLVDVGRGGTGRGNRITLTPAGREMLARAYPLWEQAQAHIAEKLGAEGRRQAQQVLGDLGRIG